MLADKVEEFVRRHSDARDQCFMNAIDNGLASLLAGVLVDAPGKEEVDREMLAGLSVQGQARDAYIAARRAQGLKRETVWHQKKPNGTLAIVVLEGDDVQSALGVSATSDDPFHRQFRDFVKDVHGVDLANDPPPDIRQLTGSSPTLLSQLRGCQ